MSYALQSDCNYLFDPINIQNLQSKCSFGMKEKKTDLNDTKPTAQNIFKINAEKK